MSDLCDEDIDLRDFAYMPLHIGRLQKSKAWLACKRDPSLAFYMLNLWMRSWHEVPCGSIEDDDDVLADAAMCTVKEWERVKEKTLRGWEKRGDRLFHPVVTEIATDSWEKKKNQRRRTSSATEARTRNRHEQRNGQRDVGHNEQRNDDRDVQRDDDVTSTKGREGKGREGKEDSFVDSGGLNLHTPDLRSVAENKNPPDDTADYNDLNAAVLSRVIVPVEEPAAKAKPSPLGTRLPEDWNPGHEGAAYAKGLGIDAKATWENFRDYWRSKPGAAGRKLDWPATWRMWCRTEAGRRSNSPRTTATPASSGWDFGVMGEAR